MKLGMFKSSSMNAATIVLMAIMASSFTETADGHRLSLADQLIDQNSINDPLLPNLDSPASIVDQKDVLGSDSGSSLTPLPELELAKDNEFPDALENGDENAEYPGSIDDDYSDEYSDDYDDGYNEDPNLSIDDLEEDDSKQVDTNTLEQPSNEQYTEYGTEDYSPNDLNINISAKNTTNITNLDKSSEVKSTKNLGQVQENTKDLSDALGIDEEGYNAPEIIDKLFGKGKNATVIDVSNVNIGKATKDIKIQEDDDESGYIEDLDLTDDSLLNPPGEDQYDSPGNDPKSDLLLPLDNGILKVPKNPGTQLPVQGPRPGKGQGPIQPLGPSTNPFLPSGQYTNDYLSDGLLPSSTGPLITPIQKPVTPLVVRPPIVIPTTPGDYDLNDQYFPGGQAFQGAPGPKPIFPPVPQSQQNGLDDCDKEDSILQNDVGQGVLPSPKNGDCNKKKGCQDECQKKCVDESDDLDEKCEKGEEKEDCDSKKSSKPFIPKQQAGKASPSSPTLPDSHRKIQSPIIQEPKVTPQKASLEDNTDENSATVTLKSVGTSIVLSLLIFSLF